VVRSLALSSLVAEANASWGLSTHHHEVMRSWRGGLGGEVRKRGELGRYAEKPEGHACFLS
jgi:hypothetical protein